MRRRLKKAERQGKVLQIIRENSVETQEDLAILLQKAGFDVTQATISRDIKELGITNTYGQRAVQICPAEREGFRRF